MLRRDRAARLGPAQFLFERTFSDSLERLATVKRRFRSALLLGCPDRSWPGRLGAIVDQVTVVDPGPMFAQAVGGIHAIEDADGLGDRDFDLCVAIGTLDTVNNLPLALANIATALRSDSLLIGAVGGGDTLPVLRAAMRAADAVTGSATPHIHPRIDGPSLCGLLTNAGFMGPVVDVDRVQVAYASLDSLIADLRSMAATNILTDRSRAPLDRTAAGAAAASFIASGVAGRTVETFEILHFAGWTAAGPKAELSPMGEAELT
jgi:NADH dehydrogenase [ubiquinone] 1 alpha subcomplex assembly factor 5